ncbi:hypothetical protein LX32DRAFT_640129, partial [Colletotrichum zoysiae]
MCDTVAPSPAKTPWKHVGDRDDAVLAAFDDRPRPPPSRRCVTTLRRGLVCMERNDPMRQPSGWSMIPGQAAQLLGHFIPFRGISHLECPRPCGGGGLRQVSRVYANRPSSMVEVGREREGHVRKVGKNKRGRPPTSVPLAGRDDDSSSADPKSPFGRGALDGIRWLDLACCPPAFVVTERASQILYDISGWSRGFAL